MSRCIAGSLTALTLNQGTQWTRRAPEWDRPCKESFGAVIGGVEFRVFVLEDDSPVLLINEKLENWDPPHVSRANQELLAMVRTQIAERQREAIQNRATELMGSESVIGLLDEAHAAVDKANEDATDEISATLDRA